MQGCWTGQILKPSSAVNARQGIIEYESLAIGIHLSHSQQLSHLYKKYIKILKQHFGMPYTKHIWDIFKTFTHTAFNFFFKFKNHRNAYVFRQ